MVIQIEKQIYGSVEVWVWSILDEKKERILTGTNVSYNAAIKSAKDLYDVLERDMVRGK